MTGPVFPALRSRADIDFALLQATLSGQRMTTDDLPHRTVGGELVVTLAVDQGGGVVRYVTPHDLGELGTTFEACLTEATDRLARSTVRPPQPAGDEVYAGLDDGRDPARLLLPKFLGQADVKGELIVTVPNRETLLITGSDEAHGLDNLVRMSAEAYQQGRSLDARLYRLDGDQLRLWLPPESHHLHWKCRQLAFLTESSMYNEQQRMLEQLYGETAFVASQQVRHDMQSAELPPIFSISCWSQGAVSLLPKSDYISFVRFDHAGQPLEPMVVAWKDAEPVVGGHMRPQGMYPERYRVEEFPGEAEWRTLLDKMVRSPDRRSLGTRGTESFGEPMAGGQREQPRKATAKLTFAILLVACVVATLMTLALSGVTYVSPRLGVSLAIGGLSVSCLLATMTFFSGLVHAFRERAVAGLLYLLAPLYWCYFIVSRGDRTRGPLILASASLALVLSSAISLMEGSYLARRRGRPIAMFSGGGRWRPLAGPSYHSRRNRRGRQMLTPGETLQPLRNPNEFVVPDVSEITFPELRNKEYKPVEVQLWQVAVDGRPDPPAARRDWRFELPLKGNEQIAAAPPGPYVAIASTSFEGSNVRVFDLRSGDVRSAEGPTGMRDQLALSPDGQLLAGIAENHRAIEVWSLEDSSTRTLDVEAFSVPRRLAFLAADRLLAMERTPTNVAFVVYDLNGGDGKRHWTSSHRTQEHFAVSPGGRFLSVVTQEDDGQTVTVVDLSTSKLAGQLRFPGHDGFDAPPCSGLAFSPDGKEFAVLMADANSQPSRIVRMDVESGEMLNDHRVAKSLDIFGLSPLAPGLQWASPRATWFASEQWLIECESGLIQGSPLGPIVGLSRFRRWLYDGGQVLHVKRVGSSRVLTMSRLAVPGE